MERRWHVAQRVQHTEYIDVVGPNSVEDQVGESGQRPHPQLGNAYLVCERERAAMRRACHVAHRLLNSIDETTRHVDTCFIDVGTKRCLNVGGSADT